ncbi:MAG: hypothetical protein ACREBR_01530, partial [bacterium]
MTDQKEGQKAWILRQWVVNEFFFMIDNRNTKEWSESPPVTTPQRPSQPVTNRIYKVTDLAATVLHSPTKRY